MSMAAPYGRCRTSRVDIGRGLRTLLRTMRNLLLSLVLVACGSPVASDRDAALESDAASPGDASPDSGPACDDGTACTVDTGEPGACVYTPDDSLCAATERCYVGVGCSLLQPVLMNQIHTFDPRNWEHNHHLMTLFREEERLLRAGVLEDDFAAWVAVPKA